MSISIIHLTDIKIRGSISKLINRGRHSMNKLITGSNQEMVNYIKTQLKQAKDDRANSNEEESRIYHDAQIAAYTDILENCYYNEFNT